MVARSVRDAEVGGSSPPTPTKTTKYMIVQVVKTDKITVVKRDIINILDQYLENIEDGSILCVTSKIISICENRVLPTNDFNKNELVKTEADYYLDPSGNQFNMTLTIKNSILLPTAGIDESNGNGNFILWPKNPQKSANLIRKYLIKRFKIENVGVIITDSKTTPLRWGTTGVCIAFSGFSPLKDYIGTKDIFGRKLEMTKSNHADALACAAVLAMGEGSERTPLAVIRDIPFVKFEKKNPSKKTLDQFSIDIKDDIYSNLLTSVKWHKGAK